ncbi:MAG: N-acetylmuramoyl-L-alanine amidase [Pseudomonadota bacterium]|nr:N-acetylmuramoyl-L-alanine amidase [Pseudomonadota bacterium]
MLVGGLLCSASQAAEIKGLEISNGATGTRAEIVLDAPGEFKVIRLQGPDRLVIDLPASKVGSAVRVPAPVGIVTSIRTGQPVPGTARVVFELAEPVAALPPRLESGTGGSRVILEWPGDNTDAIARIIATQSPASPAAPALQPTPAEQSARSAEATSRLISQLAARTPYPPSATPAPTPAPAPQPAPTTVAARIPTTIATGVPTRIATGVPTTVATGIPRAMSAAATPAPAIADIGADPVKTIQQVMQGRGMRPLVIAIDPGHGGQDPGAIGLKGSREKDVVLAISRELARQINATPGMQAYMTRDNDMFIPLGKRAQLARKARADMFVSIHADAAENRKATGSSVYVLSLKGASSQRARWLADKENSSDLIGGVRMTAENNTLASVLLDLTQSGQLKASEDAAGEVLDGLKRVGNNHKPHIERANFAVLRSSDMPAMLVETAFISNPEEERRLLDPGFQRKLAGAVLDGINTFFTRQPPPGTMFAARAAAATIPLSGSVGGSP